MQEFVQDCGMEVALMTELLQHGADANHADELVSFCLQFVG